MLGIFGIFSPARVSVCLMCLHYIWDKNVPKGGCADAIPEKRGGNWQYSPEL